ncbi:MAG: hypothetical protein IH984_12200 [Planctomycetes bacterium]|nr:hypothetical protein [Planctomycetota bacterium]
MKRRLFKLVLFLFLGAIVNIAIAWACAVWINPAKFDPWPEIGFRSSGQYTWKLIQTNAPGMTLYSSTRSWSKEPFDIRDHGAAPEEMIPSWSDLGELSEDFKKKVARKPDYIILEKRWIYCYGWPARSLWSYWYNIDPTDLPHTYGSEGYIYQFGSWDNFVPRILATRPIWLGFILNTIFYAAILCLIILGLFKLRCTIRRKHGHCIKCGYDLRNVEHEKCPECGARTWRESRV